MTLIHVINSKRVNYERRLNMSYSSLNRPFIFHSSVVQPIMSGLWLAYDNSRLAMALGQAPLKVIDKFIHGRRSPLYDRPG